MIEQSNLRYKLEIGLDDLIDRLKAEWTGSEEDFNNIIAEKIVNW